MTSAAKEAVEAADGAETPKLDSPALYINRELSQLEFNRRVLDLAKSADVPLLERLRFLCIAGSILDEFFEIRVAGLKQQQETRRDPARPGQPLAVGAAAAHRPGGSRSGGRAVPHPQRRAVSAPRCAGHPLSQARAVARRSERRTPMARGLLPSRARTHPHAHRPRPGASVPEDSQQEPHLHRDLGGQGRLRAQQRHGRGAGAAFAAAGR